MILLVITLVVGPSRLPAITETVTRWIKRLRIQLTKWRANLDAEIGDDLKGVDLSKLDPRLYDPRRMIREAVQEEMDEWKKLVGPLGIEPGSLTTRPQSASSSKRVQPARPQARPAQSSSAPSQSSAATSTGGVASSSSSSAGSAASSIAGSANNSIFEGEPGAHLDKTRARRRPIVGSAPTTKKSRARNLRRK